MSAELKPISHVWWLFLVTGVLNLIVGVLVIIHPGFTLLALGIVLGFYLLLAALMAIVEGIAGVAESRALSIVLGIVALIAGVICIRRPGDSLLAIVIVAGIYLVAAGSIRFALAFALPGARGLPITVALLQAALGIAILAWPKESLGTLAILFGIGMLIHGLFDLITAFTVRSARHAGAALPPPAVAA